MEDQEIRIIPNVCDEYHIKKETEDNGLAEPPLSVVMTSAFSEYRKKEISEFCDNYEDIPSQIIVAKFFAYVFEKRVWKRRLIIITKSMVLVMKRPDDHYLKNAFYFKDMKEATAVVPKKEVNSPLSTDV